MTTLIEAIDEIKSTLNGLEVHRINHRNVEVEELLQIYYQNGYKRKFGLVTNHACNDDKCIYKLPVKGIPLTQWQTIAYYYLVTNDRIGRSNEMKHFLDLDLLVENNYKKIDDMHNTCALLQTPDLPYKFVEHTSFFINQNGEYENEIKDILKYLRENIKEGTFVAVELDVYYIDKTIDYHYALRYMVIGFDDFEEKLTCIGFQSKIFREFQISFDEFLIAYEYSKIVNINAPLYLELYKPKKGVNISRNVEEGRDKILAYYRSANSYSILQAEEKKGRWTNCSEYVGREASEKFYELLLKMDSENINVCYQCLHAFYENKVMLLERSREFLGENSLEYMESSVKCANIARQLYMKYLKKDEKRILLRCVNMIKSANEAEKQYFQHHFA